MLYDCRARPTGLQWRPLWDSMAQECREELTLVEADTLLDTLEAYLQKHRYKYSGRRWKVGHSRTVLLL